MQKKSKKYLLLLPAALLAVTVGLCVPCSYAYFEESYTKTVSFQATDACTACLKNAAGTFGQTLPTPGWTAVSTEEVEVEEVEGESEDIEEEASESTSSEAESSETESAESTAESDSEAAESEADSSSAAESASEAEAETPSPTPAVDSPAVYELTLNLTNGDAPTTFCSNFLTAALRFYSTADAPDVQALTLTDATGIYTATAQAVTPGTPLYIAGVRWQYCFLNPAGDEHAYGLAGGRHSTSGNLSVRWTTDSTDLTALYPAELVLAAESY